MNFSTRQLQAKFKHAIDFGVSGRWSNATGQAFEAALQAHVDDAATMVINGTYRGQSVVHYVNPSTGLNVIKGVDDPAQLENVLTRGSL